MKVLVDSSAWIDFLNGASTREGELVRELLLRSQDVCTCGLIALEVLQGLRSDRSVRAITARFADLAFLESAGLDIHVRAAALFRDLRRRGVTVRSTADCLIVALAERHGCALLARDADMDRILASGLATVPGR